MQELIVKRKESYLNFSDFIFPILYSIVGSIIAGLTMGIINILVELIKKDSIFVFGDIFHVSFWYMIVWSIIGVISGIIYAIFLVLRGKKLINYPSQFIYIYVYFSIWLFIFMYVNIYLFAGFFSLQSIIFNLIIIFIGVILFILISKKKKFLAYPLIIYVGTLIIIFLFSLILCEDFLITSEKNLSVINNIKFKRYNVILILLDAVRFDHVGCYGYKRKTTPNIDRLAENGVIFENAFSHSSHTLESVPSLLTSTYPSTHNVKTITSAIPDDILTLPEIFKSYGYKTAIFSTNPYISVVYGYGKGIDKFHCDDEKIIKINKTVLGHSFQILKKLSVLGRIFEPFSKLNYFLFSSKNLSKSTDPNFITHKIIKWIKKNKSHPFFIYSHYEGGHSPYKVPKFYQKLFASDYSREPVINYPLKFGLFLPFEKGESLPKQKLKNMIAQYDAKIFYHDESLGILFQELKNLNLQKKTIIIITSDHGEEFYEHEGWGHGHSLYEETIHVPLIFYCPGLIPKGKRIKEIVSLVDVFPTILSLCGINLKIPYKIEGLDLTPLFYAKNPKPIRNFIFSELTQGENSAWCLRTDRYKVIEIRFGIKRERLLFDLKADPNEKNNIYEEKKEIAIELLRKLNFIIQQAEEKSFSPKKTELDIELKRKLKSLGYIEN
jgi:arylsulfatase A-like enzyme